MRHAKQMTKSRGRLAQTRRGAAQDVGIMGLGLGKAQMATRNQKCVHGVDPPREFSRKSARLDGACA